MGGGKDISRSMTSSRTMSDVTTVCKCRSQNDRLRSNVIFRWSVCQSDITRFVSKYMRIGHCAPRVRRQFAVQDMLTRKPTNWLQYHMILAPRLFRTPIHAPARSIRTRRQNHRRSCVASVVCHEEQKADCARLVWSKQATSK